METDTGGKSKKMHPNSLANLLPPWEKGQSGNPKGRPPNEKCLTFWLRQFQDLTLNELNELDENSGDLSVAQLMALKQVNQALGSNQRAAEHVWDRLEGRVPVSFEHSGALVHRIERVTTVRSYPEGDSSDEL